MRVGLAVSEAIFTFELGPWMKLVVGFGETL